MVLQQVREDPSEMHFILRHNSFPENLFSLHRPTHPHCVCQDYTMPEDKNCTLLQPSRNSDRKNKKKKKKKKKRKTPPENTERPEAVSLPPETLPASLLLPKSLGHPRGQLPKLRTTSKKAGERPAGSSRRSDKHPKDSPTLLTATTRTSGSGALQPQYLAELSTQAKESLRWEGVLEDPQAEEKRLELYRANRRRRYIAHREALVNETQNALKHTFLKEKQREKCFD